jgi:hypothetical protein
MMVFEEINSEELYFDIVKKIQRTNSNTRTWVHLTKNSGGPEAPLEMKLL